MTVEKLETLLAKCHEKQDSIYNKIDNLSFKVNKLCSKIDQLVYKIDPVINRVDHNLQATISQSLVNTCSINNPNSIDHGTYTQ